MYIPPHFAETRPEELQRVIREYPFGTLVTQTDQGLDANHVPFEFDPSGGAHGLLTCHVARANPVWKELVDGASVMVIFRSDAHGYISPSWYPSKHEAHRQVPTWNYEVVHAHGTVTLRDDERFVRGVVARLTRQHEAGEPKPWKMTDSAPEFIDTLLKAIVGIEIDIVRLEGKAKFSQNKDARDRAGAADALSARGEDALAVSMRKTLV